MQVLNKIGAVSFILWGLLHIVGGSSILFALNGGPEQGYAIYQYHEGSYTALSGAILGYFAFLLVCIGLAVTVVGGWLNWRNSRAGLAINTLLIGLTDLGLIVFLVSPGFVSWGEATIGLGLFVVAMTAGGIACNSEHK